MARAQATAPVRVMADPARCAFQFDPIENAAFRSSCDVAKNVLGIALMTFVVGLLLMPETKDRDIFAID